MEKIEPTPNLSQLTYAAFPEYLLSLTSSNLAHVYSTTTDVPNSITRQLAKQLAKPVDKLIDKIEACVNSDPDEIDRNMREFQDYHCCGQMSNRKQVKDMFYRHRGCESAEVENIWILGKAVVIHMVISTSYGDGYRFYTLQWDGNDQMFKFYLPDSDSIPDDSRLHRIAFPEQHAVEILGKTVQLV